MPTITTMTLEDKLRAILFEDDTGHGPISQCGTQPGWRLTVSEMDLRDWGCVYGMAFGIARQEEPSESIEQVAARAVGTAWTVFREWGTRIAERGEEEEV